MTLDIATHKTILFQIKVGTMEKTPAGSCCRRVFSIVLRVDAV
jgi:hypothetical protein